MVKKSSWVSSQGTALPRWAGEATPYLEEHSASRVGVVPARMPISQCCCYEGVGMIATHAEVPPLSPNHYSWRNGLWTAIHEDLTGVSGWRDPGDSWTSIVEAVWGCAEHSSLLASGAVFGRAPWVAGPVPDKGLSPRSHKNRPSLCSEWEDALMPTPCPKLGHLWRKQEKEVAKWPRDYSLMRSLQPCSRHSRSRVQQDQSQSLGHQQPSKEPPCASTRRLPRHVSPSLAHHTQNAQTSIYTALWADFTCSTTVGICEEGG